MKVLITGGAGYIGTSLIPELLNLHLDVRIFDNLLYGGDHLLRYVNVPEVEFFKGDIRDEGQVCGAALGCDVVVHLAAMVGFAACRRDPDAAWKVNATGTSNVVKAMGDGQYLILASTGSNYGKIEGICTEESPLNPLSIYADTKVKAEEVARSQDLNTIFRFATAFGVSPRLRLDLLINNLTYLAATQKYILVYEPEFRRTFFHVRDIAKAIAGTVERYMDNNTMVGETFNVGDSSMNMTKRDIAEIVGNRTGAVVNYSDYDTDVDKRDYEVSYDKFKHTGIPIKPISVEDGVRELAEAIEMIDERSKYFN